MTWYGRLAIVIFMVSCIVSLYHLGTAIESLTTRIETLESDLIITDKKCELLLIALKKTQTTLYEMWGDYWSEGSEVGEGRYIKEWQ